MISLIISFYKRIDFLDLILQSVEKQSYKNFEVIIAEDNNDVKTTEYLRNASSQFNFTIKHVQQEDIGFRKTKILNEALKIANGDKIVFIDGDCILHKHFLKQYNLSISDKNFCYGRRVYLSKIHTDKLLTQHSIQQCSNLRAILYGGKSIGAGYYLPFLKTKNKQHRRILGCNWGVAAKNIFAVNGFDEDYNKAGVGEDFDIDWRLKKQGLYIHSMKNKAIVFHMYHSPNYQPADTLYVENLMAKKMTIGEYFCINGLKKQ